MKIDIMDALQANASRAMRELHDSHGVTPDMIIVGGSDCPKHGERGHIRMQFTNDEHATFVRAVQAYVAARWPNVDTDGVIRRQGDCDVFVLQFADETGTEWQMLVPGPVTNPLISLLQAMSAAVDGDAAE